MRTHVKQTMNDLFTGKNGRHESTFAQQSGESFNGAYFPTAYSYGTHFPLVILTGSVAMVNRDKYSMTTSHHQSSVRAYLALAGYYPTGAAREHKGHTYELWQSEKPHRAYTSDAAAVA